MRVGSTVTVTENGTQPSLVGYTGTIIWRGGRKWVRIRIDNHRQPMGHSGKGWFLPYSAVRGASC